MYSKIHELTIQRRITNTFFLKIDRNTGEGVSWIERREVGRSIYGEHTIKKT